MIINSFTGRINNYSVKSNGFALCNGVFESGKYGMAERKNGCMEAKRTKTAGKASFQCDCSDFHVIISYICGNIK
jgi:hypothetical protein